jgi:hypothetical protein
MLRWRCLRPHSGERLDQFGLAVPADAGDPVDLSGANMKRGVGHGNVPVGARRL